MKYNTKLEYVLCIETTSEICSVAIYSHDLLVDEINYDLGLNHSVTLFTAINDLLIKNNIDTKYVSKIKVSCGPGSFTCIRIGIACASGLSKANNIPIEYIDTLDSLTANAGSKSDFILSMIDARNNRVYFSFFDTNYNKLIKDTVVDINDLIGLLNKYFGKKNVSIIFVGNGAKIYKNELKKKLNIKFNILNSNLSLKASFMQYKNGIIDKKPYINYILASKAEKEFNGKC